MLRSLFLCDCEIGSLSHDKNIAMVTEFSWRKFTDDYDNPTCAYFFFLVGAFLVSVLASPVVLAMNLMHLPKVYSLYAGEVILLHDFMVLHSAGVFPLLIRRKNLNVNLQLKFWLLILFLLSIIT